MLGKSMLDNLRRRGKTEPTVSAQGHYANGVELVQEGSFAEALEEFKQAIKGDPRNINTQLHAGFTYEQLGRPNHAIKAYLKVLEIQPDCVEAFKHIGLAYNSMGQFLKALKMFIKAIGLAPSDLGLRNDLGSTYFQIGSYAEAIKAHEQALRMDPDDSRAHYCLALVYLDLENKDFVLEEVKVLKQLNQAALVSDLTDRIDKQFTRSW